MGRRSARELVFKYLFEKDMNKSVGFDREHYVKRDETKELNESQHKYILDTVEGVFANPRAVHNYKNPDGTPCYDPDVDNYPLSGRMVDAIMDLIKTKELNLFMQIVEDSTNNASNKS